MSRFSGWNGAAVLRLTGESKPVLSKQIKNIPDHVAKIETALRVFGLIPVREYKFCKDRRFRFDLAFPEKKIAIEFEGGIFGNGRHTRGKGYSNDAKKYNLATMHGWKLLRYTTADIKNLNWEFAAADEIKKLIEG